MISPNGSLLFQQKEGRHGLSISLPNRAVPGLLPPGNRRYAAIDVYKRQALWCWAARPTALRPCSLPTHLPFSATACTVPRSITPKSRWRTAPLIWTPRRTATVSYTHLDVYKRQECGQHAGENADAGKCICIFRERWYFWWNYYRPHT